MTEQKIRFCPFLKSDCVYEKCELSVIDTISGQMTCCLSMIFYIAQAQMIRGGKR